MKDDGHTLMMQDPGSHPRIRPDINDPLSDDDGLMVGIKNIPDYRDAYYSHRERQHSRFPTTGRSVSLLPGRGVSIVWSYL